MQDIVHDEVFSLYPSFMRGVVIASGLRLSDYNPRIADFLSDAQERRKEEGVGLLDSPRLAAWDDAHRKFNSNPKRFPPSIRSLTERVLRGKPLPYINDAVALFNAVSLKYLIPCGGDNVDALAGDARLGIAKGRERFTPLGGGAVEHPGEGEVIYYDDGDFKVMCRRWNWRNGDETKITGDTRNLLINVDGLGDDIGPVVKEAADEIATWLERECGGQVRRDVLHAGRPAINV
ncbi:MAG: phenylalanine--tRNA ligase beta subunit-related protein [Pyrinomonadaceae bacterium]